LTRDMHFQNPPENKSHWLWALFMKHELSESFIKAFLQTVAFDSMGQFTLPKVLNFIFIISRRNKYNSFSEKILGSMVVFHDSISILILNKCFLSTKSIYWSD